MRSELTMTTGRYGGRFVGQTVWNGASPAPTSSATTPILPVTPSVTTQPHAAEGQPVAPVAFATEQMARMILAQEQLSSDKFFNPRIGLCDAIGLNTSQLRTHKLCLSVSLFLTHTSAYRAAIQWRGHCNSSDFGEHPVGVPGRQPGVAPQEGSSSGELKEVRALGEAP